MQATSTMPDATLTGDLGTSVYGQSLAELRERIFLEDVEACFLEREENLCALEPEAAKIPGPLRYSWLLDQLLQRLSTPIVPGDVLLGRMVEGRTARSRAYYGTGPWQGFVNSLLRTSGHHTPDHHALLTLGLDGVARQAAATAARLGTEEAKVFAENCRVCANAIGAYASRYAQAAQASGDPLAEEASRALKQVPFLPARSFYEALQSISFYHFIISCVVGGRDVAYGRLDQYLLGFYNADVESGCLKPEEARDLLAHLMIKANEIAGSTSWEHPAKLVPCVGSKQYVFVGGCSRDGTDEANELSELVLDAARLVNLREPVLNVRLHGRSTHSFRHRVARAVMELKVELQLWNDDVIAPALHRLGFASEDAYDYMARGCSTTEVGMRQYNHDILGNLVPWIMEALRGETPQNMEEVLDRYEAVARRELHRAIQQRRADPEPTYDRPFTNDGGLHFHLESMLLRDCVQQGRTHCAGGIRYHVRTAKLTGIATAANSLMTVHRLVFEDRALSVEELLEICHKNYEGKEVLRQKIINSIPKFGNDDDRVDSLARAIALRTAQAGDDALAEGRLPGEILITGLYSQHLHLAYGRHMGATPDGRMAGEPLSENQSPSYGTDTAGLTAVLSSVGKLPFDRLPAGGLNVRLASKICPEQLEALTRAFFNKGGLMLGYTLVGRDTLQAARQTPQAYRSLTVRQFGFSEYFTVLSPAVQDEIIDRTEY